MLQGLVTPIAADADPAQAAILLEQACKCLLSSAQGVAATHRRMEAQVREYNFAHGFTPIAVEPNRQGNVRRNLGNEMAGGPAPDAEPAGPAGAPPTRRPVYSSRRRT